MDIQNLYTAVRANPALLKDPELKKRLPELATYIPDDYCYPLIHCISYEASFNPEFVDYLEILLDNGADPNEKYLARPHDIEYPLDRFFSGLKYGGYELAEYQKKALTLLIQYSADIKLIRTKQSTLFKHPIIAKAILFCYRVSEEWRNAEEELSCKQVDE